MYPTHDLDDFKGGMAENCVCNQLVAGRYSCYYWTGDHSYEVDFLLQPDGAIIPIRVKAAEHTMEDGQKLVPLYAAFCV